jgi:DNA mismatch repair protein MLH1
MKLYIKYYVLAIKKTLEDLYTVYLPKKAHPWCYISLEIDPQNIDVNVHPTKYEVRFLHEDAIIEKIKNVIDEKLSSNDASRIFYIQAKLPKVDITKEIMQNILPNTPNESDKTTKIQPKDMIRTSSTDQKLDKFNFTTYKNNESNINLENDRENINMIKDKQNTNIEEDTHNIDSEVDTQNTDTEVDTQNTDADAEEDMQDKNISKKLHVKDIDLSNDSNFILGTKDASKSVNIEDDNLEIQEDSSQVTEVLNEKVNTKSQTSKETVNFKSYSVNEVRVETKLLSVLTLRKEIEETYHEGLREILSNLIFVGCVDECSALIQSGVSLYICNTQKLV